jgi:lipopolysaccharide export system ATP-binding protein
MSNLKTENLQKSYKSRKVVDSVSIEVNSGEIVGLLGPNGAGKTTTFYMVVGLIQSEAGKILFDNKDITKLPIHMRARLGLGYLPQEPSVFRKLTVKENILAILELQKHLSIKQRLERLETLLEEFHIGHVRDNVGFSLSGGERRRVEIARALANDPKFFLLDEPFAGIDPISVVDIKQIIRHLRSRNIGILITDHNVRETLDICNRAYIVSNGKIICSGGPKNILNNKLVREVYLGSEFEL